ncbi:hypothetical protein Micbo1qcDRAFT_169838, partial [Microdochium bolleyi]
MGKCGDRTTLSDGCSPVSPRPRCPTASARPRYGLVQPSTRICRNGRHSPDEILVTLKNGDAHECTALVDERRHAGITS